MEQALVPRLTSRQNHSELSVLHAFGSVGIFVALALYKMRLVFEALIFCAAGNWSSRVGVLKVQCAKAGLPPNACSMRTSSRIFASESATMETPYGIGKGTYLACRRDPQLH
jgi:hypothetical protein